MLTKQNSMAAYLFRIADSCLKVSLSGKEVGDNDNIVVCFLEKAGVLFLVDEAETFQVNDSGICSSAGLLHFKLVNNVYEICIKG